jgi:hypothetical protein
VKAAQPIARLLGGLGGEGEGLVARFLSFVQIGDEAPASRPLVHEVLR